MSQKKSILEEEQRARANVLRWEGAMGLPGRRPVWLKSNEWVKQSIWVAKK